MNDIFRALDEIREPLSELLDGDFRRDVDGNRSQHLEALLGASDERIEAYVYYMMLHAELAHLGPWQAGFEHGQQQVADEGDALLRALLAEADTVSPEESHKTTASQFPSISQNPQRNTVMSQQSSTSSSNRSRFVTAASVLVLIGGAVALLSLPSLQSGRVAVENTEPRRSGERLRYQDITLAELGERDVQRQLAGLVTEFNSLVNERDFREAERVVWKAEALAPQDPLVTRLKTTALFNRHHAQNGDSKEQQENGVHDFPDSVSRSLIPYGDREGTTVQLPTLDFATRGENGKKQPTSNSTYHYTGKPGEGTVSGYERYSRGREYANRSGTAYGLPKDGLSTSKRWDFRSGKGDTTELNRRVRLGANSRTWAFEVDGKRSNDLTGKLATLNGRVRDGRDAKDLGREKFRLEEVPRTDRPVGGDAEGRIIEEPESARDRYERIVENAFKAVSDHPLSTFSIDVDTASYANTRQYLMQSGSLPPADAVRIEEMVNYFDYGYEGPKGDDPFASHIEIASCPWQPKHRLVRVALKGKEIHRKERPKSNLVFLIDVSGSMNSVNKLPLVKEGLKLLTKELGNDKELLKTTSAFGGPGKFLLSSSQPQ